MKQLVKVLFIPFVAMLVLTGCGDDDEVKNPTVKENENPADHTENGTDGNEKLPFTFKAFNLEVDYKGNDNDYEAEYDTLGAKTEASIEDERNKHEVKGDEAMEELTPILEKLEFTQDSKDEEVIEEVTKAFDVIANYQELELEVTYSDGKTRVYKVVNN